MLVAQQNCQTLVLRFEMFQVGVQPFDLSAELVAFSGSSCWLGGLGGLGGTIGGESTRVGPAQLLVGDVKRAATADGAHLPRADVLSHRAVGDAGAFGGFSGSVDGFVGGSIGGAHRRFRPPAGKTASRGQSYALQSQPKIHYTYIALWKTSQEGTMRRQGVNVAFFVDELRDVHALMDKTGCTRSEAIRRLVASERPRGTPPAVTLSNTATPTLGIELARRFEAREPEAQTVVRLLARFVVEGGYVLESGQGPR